MDLGIWIIRTDMSDRDWAVGSIVNVRPLKPTAMALRQCHVPYMGIIALTGSPEDADARVRNALESSYDDDSDPNNIVFHRREMTALWASLRPPIRRQLEDFPHWLELEWSQVAEIPLRNKRLGVDTSLIEVYNAGAP